LGNDNSLPGDLNFECAFLRRLAELDPNFSAYGAAQHGDAFLERESADGNAVDFVDVQRAGQPRCLRWRIGQNFGDPQKAIVDGKMREDLYYRLNVFPIEVPPLRERLEDIPLFSHFFLQKLNETEEKKVESIEADFIEALQQYEWPGNVRELRNVINRAFIMARGSSLTVECLPDKLLSARKRRTRDGVMIPLGQPMEEVERIVIEETLNMTDGDRRKTAEILGISYKTLYNKTKKYKAAGGGDDEEEE